MRESKLISERAENIAIIRFTEDPDVRVIYRNDPVSPFDLQLGLSREGKKANWMLSVEVKGLRNTDGHWHGLPLTRRLQEEAPTWINPCAILGIDIDTQTLYFAWLLEPIAEPAPQLRPRPLSDRVRAKRFSHRDLMKAIGSARDYFEALA